MDAKDVNKFASYFDEDASAFYPRSEPSLGKGEIRRDWADFFSRKNVSHPVTTEEVITAASGDLGYVIGSTQGS